MKTTFSHFPGMFENPAPAMFEKCEWCAAFLGCCASDKRNNQIQNKLAKNIIKYKLYTNASKNNCF